MKNKKRLFILFLILITAFIGAYSCSPTTPPDTPENVSASDGEYTNKIVITWDSTRKTNGYKIYRSTTKYSEYEEIATTPNTSYEDSSVTDLEIYYYKVKSYNELGESDYSDDDSGFLQEALDTPTNLSASKGTYRDKIRITWNSVNGADGYRVYRSNQQYEGYEYLGMSSADFYDDKPITTNVYYYKVNAYSDNGYSDYSNSDDGYRAEIDAPTNVDASDAEYRGKVEITWEAVSEADTYKIYRSATPTGTNTLLGEVSTTTYDDFAPTTDVYYYRVKASDAYGDSDYSAYDEGSRKELETPSNLSATKGTYTDKIEVTWDEVLEANEYDVYSSSSIDGTYIKADTVTTNLYTDTTRTDTETYYYKVKAVDNYGTSGMSSADDGYLDSAFTSEPVISATDGDVDGFRYQIKITWDHLADADGYRVYRSTLENGSYTFLGTTADNYYDDVDDNSGNNLLETSAYWYKINAYKTEGYSHFSNKDEGSLKELSPPTNVQADDGIDRDRISISWTGVAEATQYKIYRSASSTGTYSYVGTTAGTETDYDDTSVSGDMTTYYYKVKSSDAYGDSLLSTDYDSGHIKYIDPPSNVDAEDGLNREEIIITWTTSPSTITGYNIYRSTSSTTGFTQIDSISGTSYNDNDANLEYGQTYYYKLTSYDAYGESDFSNIDEGSLKTLPAPINVSASDGMYRDHIEITWSIVSDAVSGYKVYRSSSSTSDYAQIGSTLSSTENSFDDYDSNLEYGQTYYYKVKAVDLYGESQFSDYNVGSLEVLEYPSWITATDTLTGSIDVEWASVTYADGYNVYRSTSYWTGFTQIGSTNSQYDTLYSDTDGSLVPGETYYYKVTAYDTYGESDFSDYTDGSLEPINAPININASNGVYANKIEVTWDSVSGADEYKVYRYTSSTPESSFVYIGTSVDTSYNDDIGDVDPPSSGITYYYRVSTVDNGSESDLSTDYDSGYLLEAPDGINASDGYYTDLIEITWNSVTNADEYWVYRNAGSVTGTFTKIGTTYSTTFDDTDSSLSDSETYYYRVKSVDINGNATELSDDYDWGYLDDSAVGTGLYVNGSWEDGNITAGGEHWYHFDAVDGNTYTILWKDMYSDPTKSYTADIKVTAYREDMTTSYFVGEDASPVYITALGTEKVYLKVEGFDQYESGTYSISVTD